MSSTSDISDVDTDAEKELLRTTDDEIESPIKIATLYEKSTKLFSYNEINTKVYWREIRRILYNHIDVSAELSGIHYLSFCQTFEKKNGEACQWSKPWYDAWCLVKGTSRKGFDVQKFLLKYPTVEEQLSLLRKICNISVNIKYRQ